VFVVDDDDKTVATVAESQIDSVAVNQIDSVAGIK
jgi:hypothetical protein